MGLYARRSIQAVALVLGGITIFITVTGHGSSRAYFTTLFGALLFGLWSITAGLMRHDRGIIAATRIVTESMREARGNGPQAS